MMAMAYGNVYVARVAIGVNDMQTVKAFSEAEAYDGLSLIIAYSHCIAHGYDLMHGLDQQKAAVQSGHWPLFRYNPDLVKQGKNPLRPGLQGAQHAAGQVRLQRDALHHAGPQRSRGGQAAARRWRRKT